LSLVLEPARPAGREVRARRMRDHQIPPHLEHAQHVALDVRPRRLGREEIARHRLMPASEEGIPYRAAELAGHQDSHDATSRYSLTVYTCPSWPRKRICRLRMSMPARRSSETRV